MRFHYLESGIEDLNRTVAPDLDLILLARNYVHIRNKHLYCKSIALTPGLLRPITQEKSNLYSSDYEFT